jgi:hypothetical protein
VSENGIISFRREQASPPLLPGPSLLQDAGETFLVAPFWADFDGGSGSVRFEVYESSTAQGRLDVVSDFVLNRTSDIETFNPTWVLLAEWRDRLPLGTMNTSLSVRNNDL